MRVIPRDAIPNLRHVQAGDLALDLGEHRDLRRHPVLAAFMPESGRLSLSWTGLGPGQVLEPHVHPTKSLVLICAGSGRLLGETPSELVAGDCVIVPPGRAHGFEGCPPDGVTALSVQFEGLGLYEVPTTPRVAAVPDALETLLDANRERLARHLREPFFAMLQDGTLDEPDRRRRFFRIIRFWSDRFQDVLLARQASCSDPGYYERFLQHLREEADHNLLLDGYETPPLWDPILDAAAQWFCRRMQTLDNIEKLALMSLVLETSAHRFHLAVRPMASADTSAFLNAHRADSQHEVDGLDLLADWCSHNGPARLDRVLREGWSVLDTLVRRMADLVLEEPGDAPRP